MKEIDNLGNGLDVTIDCRWTLPHNFLAFSLYYSLTKNLPDATVKISCRKPVNPELPIFGWARKVNVPFFFDLKTDDITLTPDVVCLKPLDEKTLTDITDETFDPKNIPPAKNREPQVFCSLSEGCGLFVPDKWIHKVGHPFGKTELLAKGDLSVNEKKVFVLWKKLCPLFDAIN